MRIIFIGHSNLVSEIAKAFPNAFICDDKDSFAKLNITKDDICISVGASWILTKEQIEGKNIYNLHGTRLPRDRGGTIFSW